MDRGELAGDPGPAAEDVELRIDAIERDTEHGAAFLTAEAVRALGDAARAYDAGAGWEPFVTQFADRLAAAKPAMAGLRNATRRLLGQLVGLGPLKGRREAQRLSEKLLADLLAASESSAANGARLLPSVGTILTCSYSSAVVRVCLKARGEDKSLVAMVYGPSTDVGAPGPRLAAELAGRGFSTRLVGDLDVHDAVSRSQAVLIGADAVTPAFVVNGTPSLSLAEGASGRIPVYVVCETVKLAREATAPTGYDRVPLWLVTGVVTEEGVLEPENIDRFVERPVLRFP